MRSPEPARPDALATPGTTDLPDAGNPPRQAEVGPQARPGGVVVHRLTGRHVKGCGQASAWAERRAALFRQHFGGPLLGTWNVRLDQDRPVPCRPAADFGPDVEPRQLYFPCAIEVDPWQPVRGWFVHWQRPSDGAWRPDRRILEVYTRKPINGGFRGRDLSISIPEPVADVGAWARGYDYWFQGHPWLPVQRSDSALLWQHIGREDFEGRRVLDYGCHTGYHAFEASRRGGVVTGVDKDVEIVRRAQEINDHVELLDATFHVKHTIPEGHWDVLLCLSVIHQIDPTYASLDAWIKRLRRAARVVWLELINPPLKGRLTRADVDRIVGAEPVLHYRHRVRRWRSLYRLEGE